MPKRHITVIDPFVEAELLAAELNADPQEEVSQEPAATPEEIEEELHRDFLDYVVSNKT